MTNLRSNYYGGYPTIPGQEVEYPMYPQHGMKYNTMVGGYGGYNNMGMHPGGESDVYNSNSYSQYYKPKDSNSSLKNFSGTNFNSRDNK